MNGLLLWTVFGLTPFFSQISREKLGFIHFYESQKKGFVDFFRLLAVCAWFFFHFSKRLKYLYSPPGFILWTFLKLIGLCSIIEYNSLGSACPTCVGTRLCAPPPSTTRYTSSVVSDFLVILLTAEKISWSSLSARKIKHK